MSCKVLVTGLEGQLALTIKKLYFRNDNDVEFTFTSKNQLDITKPKEIENFLTENQFDYCINCAAYTNVEGAETEIDKAFEVNARAVKDLAENCSKKQIILIHISTDYVFDGKKNKPYLENDLAQPINVYGKSKLLGENYIKESNTKYFILRTSWLYSQFGNNFLKTIISKIKNNEKLNIIDSQIGSPTSTFTVAEFCYHLIIEKESNFGIYHVTSSGETSWLGFSREIADYFPNYNKDKISPVSFFKTKARRPNYSVLNNQKAIDIKPKGLLNWKQDLKRIIPHIL